MEETLPIEAETGDVPSRHLLVCSDVPVLKYRAPAMQAETLQYPHSRTATPQPAAGTRPTAVGKAMARSSESKWHVR